MKQFLLLFLFSIQIARAQTWTQFPDLPALERDDGVSKIINNKAYVGLGLRQGFTLGNDFYALDLATNTWTTIAPIPAGAERQYAVAFTYSNYFFVHGGAGTAPAFLSDTYRYDVTGNTWTTVASKPGNAAKAAASFTLNNKAYIFSGILDNGLVSDEVWEYDMVTNIWTQKNNFPFGGRWRASAASLNNFGYVIFGRDNNGSIRKEIYKYTSSTDSWTKITDFPQAKGRYYAAMETASNKLVLFGGLDTLGVYQNDCWYFDDITNTFTAGPVLPSFGRKGGMACSSGNKFYYSCGISSTARLKETWMLDVPVGLKEYENGKDLSVYPNPCSGILSLTSFSGSVDGKIEILDLLGQIRFEKYFDPAIDKSIDLMALPKGIYFLIVTSKNNSVYLKKIVRE